MTATTRAAADDIQTARQLYVETRFEEALAIARPLAEAGDPLAQNMLGVAHANGEGVPVDGIEALRWYQLAMDQGLARAFFNVGVEYSDGIPAIPDDFDLAVQHYETAAEMGYPSAFTNLGRFHELGTLGAVDLALAATYYQRGHAAGDPQSSHNLGTLIMERSDVVEGDLARARQLFAEAAIAGIADSWAQLGYMAEVGLGGPPDPVGARLFYESAVAAGSAYGAWNLAYFLNDPATPFFDPVAGLSWCLWAEREGPAEGYGADCRPLFARLEAADRAAAEVLLANLPTIVDRTDVIAPE